MKEHLGRLAFVSSVMVLSVLYGMYASVRHWFPFPQFNLARSTITNLRENWMNDFGFVPTRHLAESEDPARPLYRAHLPRQVSPGYVVISGLTPHHETLQGAVLYNAKGDEVHAWQLDYEALAPEKQPETNVMLHGFQVLPDGSALATFDNGDILARVDACGAPKWVTPGRFHHVASPTDGGVLWSWRTEDLVKLDLETGEVLEEIDLQADIVDRQQLYGMLAIRAVENKDQLQYGADAFHANDVEALSAEMAAAFPQFRVGDLLISLRELNFIGVLDPRTRQFRWWTYGPWFRQHDPDFLPDGRISVYDNYMGVGQSRIIAIDPQTDEWAVTFEGTAATPFYSWRRGKHEIMPNGHLLITESERGRVFEVTRAGRLVWERNMIYDERRNYVVTDASHLPVNFFEPGALDCER